MHISPPEGERLCIIRGRGKLLLIRPPLWRQPGPMPRLNPVLDFGAQFRRRLNLASLDASNIRLLGLEHSCELGLSRIPTYSSGPEPMPDRAFRRRELLFSAHI